MCEGRSFEEVDDLTLHDIVMMNRYRRQSPSAETLLSLLAVAQGVWKPPGSQEAVLAPDIAAQKRAVEEAFKNARFSEEDGVLRCPMT